MPAMATRARRGRGPLRSPTLKPPTMNTRRLVLIAAVLVAGCATTTRPSAPANASAAGEELWVGGSMGPSGLVPGVATQAELDLAAATFAEQAAALVEGGADLLVLETFRHLEEIRIALEAAHRAAPGMPIIASMALRVSWAKTICASFLFKKTDLKYRTAPRDATNIKKITPFFIDILHKT